MDSPINDLPFNPTIDQALTTRMGQVGIASLRQLADRAQVSRWQLRQLRQGKVAQIRVGVLICLAEALQLSLTDLLILGGESFSGLSPESGGKFEVDFAEVSEERQGREDRAQEQVKALRLECQNLQNQLGEQGAQLRRELEQANLHILEPWLKNWPKVVHATQTTKPDLAVIQILPLLNPLENLLTQWGVERIGSIGKSMAYDPQIHHLVQGDCQWGDPVEVSRSGYRHRDRLLYRAEVTT
jgi:molecular chaperone GrpE (heat shock protein)/DNA-binding Xre family transcriptional regulator